jgi:hypothetical protein
MRVWVTAALAALAAGAVACAPAGSSLARRPLHADDLTAGTYVLTYTTSSPEPVTAHVTISFDVADGGALLAARSVETGADGVLRQGTSYIARGAQHLRDYRTCHDEVVTTLPTEPTAAALIADTVGPLVPYESYGFHDAGDGPVADDGEVSSRVAETTPGVLRGRTLTRRNADGTVIEVVRDVDIRRGQRGAAREALPRCAGGRG